MLAEVTLSLEAEHAGQRQFCRVEMGQDFFGLWVIAFRRGRSGSKGRRQVMSADTVERAWAIVLSRLARYHREYLRKGADAFALQAVPDMSVSAWANAPLLPWSRFA